ncbi:iron-containing alcohol dehydrogenase, partial [Klebsiella pneumoniae]
KKPPLSVIRWKAVCQLNRDVGIPGHLREVGVRKEDIPALAQAALADVCTVPLMVISCQEIP